MVPQTLRSSSAQRPISLTPTCSENLLEQAFHPLSSLDACTLKRSAQAPGKQNIGGHALPTPVSDGDPLEASSGIAAADAAFDKCGSFARRRRAGRWLILAVGSQGCSVSAHHPTDVLWSFHAWAP
ncbi:conserved hypothetical protein [Trichinella spiralis]|uniref:hypothetical protein n=1 Tax=Trichinella spiralis TaxID=6334 RepID=UPI0001EFE071|nr:conserved hypothetical protein [Trichinella spiralis]